MELLVHRVGAHQAIMVELSEEYMGAAVRRIEGTQPAMGVLVL